MGNLGKKTEPKHFLDLNLLKTADLKVMIELSNDFKDGKNKQTP